MFGGFEHKRIDIGEITVNCVVAGSGPPLLMLHGYPQNLTMWTKVAPRLAEKFTVVCADLRGYGDSSKPRCSADRSNYSFRTMAADQVAMMRKLGFARFHVVGHDRGARTGHRMALDHPTSVATLSVLDIAPTYVMFMETDRHVSGAYWHWYFLSLPEPVPERLISADPDFFFEFCLVNWGATPLDDFNQLMLDDYRRCWRDPAMIHGSCSDYRAAATIDLEHDTADLSRKIACPTFALWGSKGLMDKHFDMTAAWRARASDLRTATLPGGHFFIDQFPEETSRLLLDFLGG